MSRLRNSRERRDFDRYLEAAFGSSTAEKLTEHLVDMVVPTPFRLRMKVVFCDENLRSVLGFQASSNEIRVSEAELVSFTIRGQVGTAHRHEVTARAAFLPTEHANVTVAVSVARHEEWQLVLRLFRRRYPALVPIYLAQRELIETVQALSKETDGLGIKVREITAREKLGEDALRRLKSVREWTEESIATVLETAADRRQSFASITLGFYRRAGETLHPAPAAICKISRDAQVQVTGRFAMVWSTAVRRIASIGAAKLASYGHRGLRERKYVAAPLEIRFRSAVLKELADVRQFIDIIGRYPHSMRSVQHGNPYAHVRVADLFDGSSFDIWSLDAQSIAIVPQLRATNASINRLIHYIFDRFREGDVREYTAE
jgi:hypothetical protein